MTFDRCIRTPSARGPGIVSATNPWPLRARYYARTGTMHVHTLAETILPSCRVTRWPASQSVLITLTAPVCFE